VSPSVLRRNISDLNTSSIFTVWDGGGCFLKHLPSQRPRRHTAQYRGADKSLARSGRKQYSDRRFWVSYTLFIIIIGGILVLFIYATRLASNEIFSPSNKIHREVGRAKDLSAPRVMWYLKLMVPFCFQSTDAASNIHRNVGAYLPPSVRRHAPDVFTLSIQITETMREKYSLNRHVSCFMMHFDGSSQIL